MKDKIIFVPYRHGYYIKYIDTKGNPKFLGKIRQDLLQTAIWFYRLEGIDLEIMEDNMNDAIDDYFEQKFQDQ